MVKLKVVDVHVQRCLVSVLDLIALASAVGRIRSGLIRGVWQFEFNSRAA
jgi:hypothetical protein